MLLRTLLARTTDTKRMLNSNSTLIKWEDPPLKIKHMLGPLMRANKFLPVVYEDKQDHKEN